jgi:hypothetical protein
MTRLHSWLLAYLGVLRYLASLLMFMVCVLFFYAFIHKLICPCLDLDLENAPIAEALLRGGAHVDTNGEYQFSYVSDCLLI